MRERSARRSQHFSLLVSQSVDAAQAERFTNSKVYETKKLLTKETLAEMLIELSDNSPSRKEQVIHLIRKGNHYSLRQENKSFHLNIQNQNFQGSAITIECEKVEKNFLLNALFLDLNKLNDNIKNNANAFASHAEQTVMDQLPDLGGDEWYSSDGQKVTDPNAIDFLNRNKGLIQELRENNTGPNAVDAKLVIGKGKLYDFEIYAISHNDMYDANGRFINNSHYINDASLTSELDLIDISTDINQEMGLVLENSTFVLSSLQALQNTNNQMKSLLDNLDTREKKARFIELVNRKNFRDDSTLTIKEVQEILSEMAHEHISVKIMRQLGEIVAQKAGQNEEITIRNLYNKSILINPDKISDIRKGFDSLGNDAPMLKLESINNKLSKEILTKYYDSLEDLAKAELLTTDLLTKSFAKLHNDTRIAIIKLHYNSFTDAEWLAHYNADKSFQKNAKSFYSDYGASDEEKKLIVSNTELGDTLKIKIATRYKNDSQSENDLINHYTNLEPEQKKDILTQCCNSSHKNKAKLLLACYENFSPKQKQEIGAFAFKESKDALTKLEAEHKKYLDLCKELENATGEHAAKLLKRKIATAVIAFVAAAAALGSAYLGLLEAGIAIGASVVGTTPIAQGSAFFTQGLEGVTTLHNQILATNPTWLIASAVGAVVIAAALVGIICLVSRNSDKSKESVERSKEQIVEDLTNVVSRGNLEKSEQSFQKIYEVLDAVKEAAADKQQEVT